MREEGTLQRAIEGRCNLRWAAFSMHISSAHAALVARVLVASLLPFVAVLASWSIVAAAIVAGTCRR